MSDSTTSSSIAIVAIITAIGAAGALLFKHVKKSDCFGVHIETRGSTPPDSPHIELTPPPQPPPPSPVNNHKNNIEPIYKEVEV